MPIRILASSKRSDPIGIPGHAPLRIEKQTVACQLCFLRKNVEQVKVGRCETMT